MFDDVKKRPKFRKSKKHSFPHNNMNKQQVKNDENIDNYGGLQLSFAYIQTKK